MHSFDIFDHRARFLDRLVSRVSADLGFKPESLPHELIRNRLSRRARELDLHLDDYVEMAASNSGYNAERTHILNALTTNTTSFFREPGHFRLLRGALLESLLEKRHAPKLKVWSAASSNGAEAYSVAMMLHATAIKRGFRLAVLGTDISTRMVDAARLGVFDRFAAESIPARLRQAYVREDRSGSGRVRIAPEIRARTRFEQLNLKAPSYPIDQDVDVIMLRNVLIYFDKDTRHQVIEQLMAHLRPGGFLMLGHVEAQVGSEMGFEECAPAVFLKPRREMHQVRVMAA